MLLLPRSQPLPFYRALLLVIIAVLVAHFFLYIFYRYESNLLEEGLVADAQSALQLASKDLNFNVVQVAEDLHVLLDAPVVQTYLEMPSNANQAKLTHLFQAYAKNKEGYSQLRFIDKFGMERVRVETGGLKVSDENLQDKSNRYYYREGMSISVGEVYVSPIDLNVENAMVEYPYVPTIRYVIGANTQEGERIGMIVLNYDASKLIAALTENTVSTLQQFEILNADGYWIYHKNSDKEWGFMRNGFEEVKLSSSNPWLWERIEASDASAINHAGTIDVWIKLSIKNLINFKFDEVITDEAFWVLRVYYDHNAIGSVLLPLKQRFYIFSLFPILIGAASLVFIYLRRRQSKELQEIHLLHAQILKFAQVSVISMDAEGKILFLNDAAEQLFGVDANEVLGLDRIALMRDITPLVERAVKLSAETGRDIKPSFEALAYKAIRGQTEAREWSLRRENGKKVPVLMTYSAIRDLDGNLEGYLEVSVDISAQKEVEAELTKARERAEELVRVKAEFLANMSHEIRTPMNGVIGLSNLLLDSELKPEQKKLVNTIVGSADVLLTVINDILDFSKIEAGGMVIENAPIDLRSVLDHSLMLFAPQAETKGIELINESDPELKYAVLGDSHRLTQVLSNLLGNAVKFTEAGSVKLKVSSTDLSEDRLSVRFEISDTGIGMSPEVQRRIFEPFVQEDSSTTRKYGGTGLGLAITVQLVKMMRGKVGVESELNKGTLFWLEIPFQVNASAVGARSSFSNDFNFDGKRALIVDDYEANLDVLEGQLVSIGFEVDTYTNGRAALDGISKVPVYSIIILDHMMPDMDGLTLAKEISSNPKYAEVPVMILSSSSQPISSQMKAVCGVTVTLQKPTSPVTLGLELKRLLRVEVPGEGHLNAKKRAKNVVKIDQSHRSLRIIMADDDPTNRLVMGLQLKYLGLEAEMVDGAKQLFEKLSNEPYDLLFLDCHMPDMDGFEVARKIRDREEVEGYYLSGHRLWIIASTAFAFEQDKDRCLESGMDDFLSKPSKVEDLGAVIANVKIDESA